MKRSLPFKSLLLCIGLLAISQQLWARDYLTMAVFQFRPENIESMGFESDVMLAIRNEMENRSEIQLMPKRDMEDVLSRRGINLLLMSLALLDRVVGLALHHDQFEARHAEPGGDTDSDGMGEQAQRRAPALRQVGGGRQ